jgi:hypothetical protein
MVHEHARSCAGNSELYVGGRNNYHRPQVRMTPDIWLLNGCLNI